MTFASKNNLQLKSKSCFLGGLVLSLCFTFFLTPQNALAQLGSNTTPQEIYHQYVNQLAQAYWSQFAVDFLPKLRSNLHIEIVDGDLIYRQPKDVTPLCPSSQFSSKTKNIIAATEYFIEETYDNSTGLANGYQMQSFYRGCSNEVVFSETMLVEGSSNPITAAEVLMGLRDFSLKPRENSKLITLQDSLGTIAIEVFSIRYDDGVVLTQFSSKNIPLVDIYFEPPDPTLQFKGSVQVEIHSGRWNHRFGTQSNSSFKFDFGSNYILEVSFAEGFAQYYVHSNGSTEPTSQNDIESRLSNQAEVLIRHTAGIFVSHFLSQFPQVLEISSSGNQRFIDDINLFIIRLESGSNANIELVIQQLRNLLTAIENGQFIFQDNRK